MPRWAYGVGSDGKGDREEMMDEADNELTHRDFLAHLIRGLQSEYEYEPLWLCLRKDLQEAALKKADESFERWKRQELESRAARRQMAKAVKELAATDERQGGWNAIIGDKD